MRLSNWETCACYAN